MHPQHLVHDWIPHSYSHHHDLTTPPCPLSTPPRWPVSPNAHSARSQCTAGPVQIPLYVNGHQRIPIQVHEAPLPLHNLFGNGTPVRPQPLYNILQYVIPIKPPREDTHTVVLSTR